MALDTDPNEEIIWDSRMSWLGAIMDWKAFITLGLWALVNRYGSRYTVTDQRVYTRYGIVSKDENIIRHEDVRDVSLQQGIVSRILRYGNIGLSTAGTAGTETVFQKVSNPSGVQETIERTIQETNSTTD